MPKSGTSLGMSAIGREADLVQCQLLCRLIRVKRTRYSQRELFRVCEGFRTTALGGWRRVHMGRRRKASREGTRGKLRWAEPRYGDLVWTVRVCRRHRGAGIM